MSIPNTQAPHVTTTDVEASIEAEHYFTAAHGCSGAAHVIHDENQRGPLAMLTFCVLILRNGTKLVGVNHGPVAAENFDPAVGRRMARQDAVRQIWPLLGYALRERAHAA